MYAVIPNPLKRYRPPKIIPAKNRNKNNSIEKKSPYSPIKWNAEKIPPEIISATIFLANCFHKKIKIEQTRKETSNN